MRSREFTVRDLEIVAFGPGAHAQPFMKEDAGFATVRLLQSGNPSEVVDRVGYNDARVGVLAADQLLKGGRRRLVYLGAGLTDRGQPT